MLFAVLVSRSIQDFLPERLRPLNAGDPHFVAPLGVRIDEMEHWSSFPSDHAALFFAFSTALWLTSRTLGAIGYAWSVFIICIPRIYSGRHYASDVVAGATIGVAVALLFARPISTKVMPWVRLAEEKYRALLRVVLCHLVPVLYNVRRRQTRWQRPQKTPLMTSWISSKAHAFMPPAWTNMTLPRSNEARNKTIQKAFRFRKTSKKVLSSIWMSSHKLQLLMYHKSNRTRRAI
jgi:hypothetical protein